MLDHCHGAMFWRVSAVVCSFVMELLRCLDCGAIKSALTALA